MRKNNLLILSLVPSAFLFSQWSAPIKLARYDKSVMPRPPSISASFGGIVHVVWCDQRSGNSQIFYRRSEDGGMIWQDEMRLTGTTGDATDPRISIAGAMNPVTHVMWVDTRDGNKEIYYKRSTDWGVSWSEDKRLTSTVGASDQPVLKGCVCCGSDVRAMWVEEVVGDRDILSAFSSDNGLTWSDGLRITENVSTQTDPCFAFCLSTVQAVWTDRRNGQTEIWGRRSTDSGENWPAEQCIVPVTDGPALSPAVAHAPNPYDSMLQLFWMRPVNAADPESSFEVWFKTSNDLGMTWGPPIRLTEPMIVGPAKQPLCASLGSVLYVMFGDPNAGIRYRSSFDKGKTWHSDSCVIRISNSRFSEPATVLAGRTMHVVWFDDHAGQFELYYARNPNGNPLPFE